MPKPVCPHGEHADFSPSFCLELANVRPENTCQMVGIFQDGTLTCQETHPWVSTLRQAFDLKRLKEGSALFIAPDVVAFSLRLPKTARDWQELGAKMLDKAPADHGAAFMVDGLSPEELLNVAYGCEMGSWRFKRFRTSARPLPGRCEQVYLIHPRAQDQDVQRQRMLDHHVVESVHWARDMANQPGNIIYPETFAQRVQEFQALGVTVKVLDDSELTEWGALLGVAQGSAHKAQVVVASWQGAGLSAPTVALVGKGVTFDSGGLSLKPANSMEDMKLDKTGAVVVAGAIRALALQKAPVNVVSVLALVENMPSGTAQRPGDIVTSLSGQTIEVLNTDAEGRLILADALTYTQNTFNPAIMVDVATLTGAVIVALGSAYAGLFTRHDDVAQHMIQSGQKTGEEVWRLPLHQKYDEAMNSDCADMKNISGSGVGAGSGTAAAFLGRFVHPTQRWAHLDIAGVDMASTPTPLNPKGGVAFGVQLLCDFVLDAFQTEFVDTAWRQKQESHNGSET